jgi:ferredoxin
MDHRRSSRQPPPLGGVSRRDFLRVSAATSMVAVVGCGEEEKETPAAPVMPREENLDTSKLKHPPSKGYLLVDRNKCQGCLTCMLSCSLAHEGSENLSLSRIQVRQNPFGKYPHDFPRQTENQRFARRVVPPNRKPHLGIFSST